MFYILNPIPVKVRLKDMTPDAALSRKMYSIGVPATLSLALPSIQVSALNAILAVYSASYVLVLGAYFKLQTFLYLTGNGVVQECAHWLGIIMVQGRKTCERYFQIGTDIDRRSHGDRDNTLFGSSADSHRIVYE